MTSPTLHPKGAEEFETPRRFLEAIDTLLKENINPEVRRYLRRLYLDLTEGKKP